MANSSRINNSIRNIYLGVIITLVNTFLSFFNRTILVKVLGKEILGLNSLFTEIIAMLSLAELGVGMAIIFSLYKPVNDKDYDRISELMSLYKSAYNLISLVIFALGLCILPFIQYFITDISLSLSYVRTIFLLFVIKSSTSYLYSYKTSILNADQKQYIVSLSTLLVKVLFTGIITLLLLTSKNYLLYLLLLIFQTISTNVILSRYVDIHYPYIKYNRQLNEKDRNEIFKNIKNIFIKRISGVITSSTDNILISSLVSTLQVGLYSNYQMVFSVARTFKQQFTNGIAGSIGNLSVTESSEHCSLVLYRLTFIYFVFAFYICNGLMGIINPFIKIWLGNNYLLSDLIVFIAILNLFIEICCDPVWQYLEVSGLFIQDKNIAVLGSVVNLVVSVIFGYKIGIVGILCGTLLTQLIQLILKINLLYKHKYNLSPKKLYCFIVKILMLFLISSLVINYFGSISFSNVYIECLFRGFFTLVISSLVILLFCRKDDGFKYMLNLGKTKLKVGNLNG